MSRSDTFVGAIFLTFVFFISFLCHASAYQTFSGKFVGVIDGDTIDVLHSDKAVRIRLEGIDCPEKGADFSNHAKQFTSSLVFGKVVEIRGKEYDSGSRFLASHCLGLMFNSRSPSFGFGGIPTKIAQFYLPFTKARFVLPFLNTGGDLPRANI